MDASPVGRGALASVQRLLVRFLITALGLIGTWQLVIWVVQPPAFMLPPPMEVAEELFRQRGFLFHHAGVTLLEIVIGFFVGLIAGMLLALAMAESSAMERLAKPLVVVSQAFPVFALAPILVLWFGYGLTSKIVMTALILFFPVTSAFYDGLKNADPNLLDLGRVYGAGKRQLMWLIKVPCAAPSLASGVRMAATVAPIGAVVGEWVGASEGLGFVMLRASARVQIDMMFAALVVLAIMALLLRFLVDVAMKRLVHWMPEAHVL